MQHASRRRLRLAGLRVSILTRPEGRVQLPYGDSSPVPSAVSILTRPEGRVQHRRCRASRLRSRGFNPHPARRPGATSRNFHSSGLLRCFNPHPARRPGATPPASPIPHLDSGFNPHPARRPGATISPTIVVPRLACFNPHPARRPGATPRAPATTAARTRFNPHPARRPGATCKPAPVSASNRVSILTRPEGRVQPAEAIQIYRRAIEVSILTRPEGRVQRVHLTGGLDVADAVSILTRPEGRVQPWLSSPWDSHNRTCFNPHPARRPGATAARRTWCATPSGFNPHPARRPGATHYLGAHYQEHGEVSILTRPEGRVQHHVVYQHENPANGFQSSPGQKAGCNTDNRAPSPADCSFNPHPARRPGAT